jgi:hypothetical protein
MQIVYFEHMYYLWLQVEARRTDLAARESYPGQDCWLLCQTTNLYEHGTEQVKNESPSGTVKTSRDHRKTRSAHPYLPFSPMIARATPRGPLTPSMFKVATVHLHHSVLKADLGCGHRNPLPIPISDPVFPNHLPSGFTSHQLMVLDEQDPGQAFNFAIFRRNA